MAQNTVSHVEFNVDLLHLKERTFYEDMLQYFIDFEEEMRLWREYMQNVG